MQHWGTGRQATTQNVAYTGTAGTITNGFGAQTYKVRVVTTTTAFILISSAGTAATTSHMYVPADTPEYFSVTPGQKVSAIQLSAGGTLYVTEMD